MKFDTPATTNPIDQLKVIGKPTDRIDGPLKTTGTAPYAYERHDVVAEAGVWLHRRRRDRQGPDRVDGLSRRESRAGRARGSSPPRTPASSARANTTPRSCSAGPRSTLSSGDRRCGRRDLRAGARRRASWCASTTRGARALRSRRREGSAAHSRRQAAKAAAGVVASAISPARSPLRRCSSMRPTRRPIRPTR